MSNYNEASPPESRGRTATSESESGDVAERAMDALRKKGNPFRQQFARNSDDAFCSIFHVNRLFADERSLPRALVDSYARRPDRPTAVLPVLGARGAGKTHLLHCLKHDPLAPAQLFVTPGTFRIDAASQDTGFLEYLLFQLINVLLAGGEQRGIRPLDFVGERLTRTLLADLLPTLSVAKRLELLPAGRVQRGLWKFGVGQNGAAATADELVQKLGRGDRNCRSLVESVHVDPRRLLTAIQSALEESETRDLKGEYRKRLLCGFAENTLLNDPAPLADFLTDGFAEVTFLARPTRTHLTLTLLQALTEVIVGSGIPIAVAFDQLEELLYGQSEEEIRRSSDGFFGGLVQLMSQAPGLCVLLFVEEGLWNRIVPQLSPHILDRIHEPVEVPEHGSIRSVRLRTPTIAELTEVVACRVRGTLAGFDGLEELPAAFPFDATFLTQLSRRETVLRLMLQGCCNRLDELFDSAKSPKQTETVAIPTVPELLAESKANPSSDLSTVSSDDWRERWFQEVRSAERKLKPVGSLAGATSELLGGLSRLMQFCRDLGVESDDWQLKRITEQISVGAHPTYGALTVAEWDLPSAIAGHSKSCRVGIGLWLGRGVGKPRDLETKLEAFATKPPLVDHLILLRPEDDARLSGRSQQAWAKVLDDGHSARIENVGLDCFARLYAFPRWLQQLHEQYPQQQPTSEMLAFIKEQAEPVLQRLMLPTESVETTMPMAA